MDWGRRLRFFDFPNGRDESISLHGGEECSLCEFFAVTLASLVLLASCGFLHDERLDGPYRLIAVDVPSEMSICYDLGNGNAIGRIPATVFAAGWNDAYIVGARHPTSNKSKVEYFYLIRALDGPGVDPKVTVRGPFDLATFEDERQRLGLPSFTRELTYLK